MFKVPGGPHTNTFELGQHGRSRTNVWEYAGVNDFGAPEPCSVQGRAEANSRPQGCFLELGGGPALIMVTSDWRLVPDGCWRMVPGGW